MSKETKNKTKKYPDLAGIFTGLLIVGIGLASLYGWWKLEPLYFTIPLYIIAVFFISIGAFGIVHELTVGGDGRVDRTNYAMVVMVLIWAASLVYPSISTDITALRLLSIAFASLIGFIGLVTLAVQVNKDIRSKPLLGWTIAFIMTLPIYIGSYWYFADLRILLLIPFTFILLYVEYLRSTFLGRAVKGAQSKGNKGVDKSETDIETPYLSIRRKLAPRDVLRNLAGIRSSLYGTLIVFFVLFYIIVTQVAIGGSHFSPFYEAVIYAYLGILAIVIAFTVLVLQRRSQKQATEHLRRALAGLVQMYVVFVFITVAGLLLGTDVNVEVLTRSVELSEILGSLDAFFNICRILAIEFTILAFPAGLLYLYAMIKDFLRP